jgi:DNA polymerase-1
VRVINTADLTPDSLSGETEKLWVYNGLDCCVTLEVFQVLEPQIDNQTRNTYEFSKSLQAPVLEMNMRGIKVDKAKRGEVLDSYRKDLLRLETQFNRIVKEVFDLDINWRSNQQLMHLFYTVMQIPPVRKRNQKGQYTPTIDREALEKLDAYFYARPLLSHLLAMRDIGKKVGVLETDIDSDGRMRTSYNIAGTVTGRFSSSLSEFGSGTNLQNIEQRLRSVFVADPGYKLAYIDGEQAESRLVGAICWNLFDDPRYLDACESGDLHTAVTRMAWTNLPWTGDLKADKKIAEQPGYRQLSYRDLAKRLGHGSNYNGKPPTMAKHTKLEVPLVRDFQDKYFTAFPGIKLWHNWTATELANTGQLTSLMGRKRIFLGRLTDDSTLREAIAYNPQSSLSDIINQGLLQVWRANFCQVLLQIHDAIVVQYPEDREEEIIPKLISHFLVPIELKGGRILRIPSEVKVGWNWASVEYDKSGNVVGNEDGLVKYNPTKGDNRRRSRPAETSVLDRRFF